MEARTTEDYRFTIWFKEGISRTVKFVADLDKYQLKLVNHVLALLVTAFRSSESTYILCTRCRFNYSRRKSNDPV